MRMLRPTYALITLGLALALLAPAPAQAQQLIFVIHDLNQPGNPIIDEVAPGGTLYMLPGDRLRVSAVAVGGGRETFLPADFWLSRSRNLAADTRHTGVAVVEAGYYGRGVLNFELDGWSRSGRGGRSGVLYIQVEDGRR